MEAVTLTQSQSSLRIPIVLTQRNAMQKLAPSNVSILTEDSDRSNSMVVKAFNERWMSQSSLRIPIVLTTLTKYSGHRDKKSQSSLRIPIVLTILTEGGIEYGIMSQSSLRIPIVLTRKTM